MDEDPAPKLAEKAEGGAGTGNPYKSTKKGATTIIQSTFRTDTTPWWLTP
jgi:hypothetical protein